jgi:hypothetical protein
MAIARAAFLEGVGVARDETELDVAELLVLLLITLEIVVAEPSVARYNELYFHIFRTANG